MYNVSVAVRGHGLLYKPSRQANTNVNMNMNNVIGNTVLPCVVNQCQMEISVCWQLTTTAAVQCTVIVVLTGSKTGISRSNSTADKGAW